jgi:hypothetical protein
MKDATKFKEFMMGLAELFDKQLSTILIDMYWKALESYTDEQCDEAFNKAFVMCKFFPKPVELIELITGGAGQLEDVAEIQATEVLRAVKRVGVYNSVLFNDPVTIAVIQQCYGGWIKLCTDLLQEEEKWFRKDFVRYYKAYKRQNILIDGHLAGLIEFDNSEKYTGFVPEPVKIEEIGKEQKLIEE